MAVRYTVAPRRRERCANPTRGQTACAFRKKTAMPANREGCTASRTYTISRAVYDASRRARA